MLGLKFRRQHVLQGFIVDFYCAELQLVVELDGSPHQEGSQAEYDAARSAWLENAGYRVIRIRNKDVNEARLEELIGDVVPPLPKGEGDRG
jgi:very-short-patch-repair endonuclease